MSIPIPNVDICNEGVNRRSPVPLYYQIKERLRDWIASGHFEPRERFPSERELEKSFGVSRLTVRRALSELSEEGYLYREQGRGSFVAHSRIEHPFGLLTSFTEDMKRRGLPSGSIVLGCTVVTDAGAADRMDIPREEALVRLVRLRLCDSQPMALQTAYIRSTIAPGLEKADLIDGSLYRTVETVYGVRIDHAVQSIEARIATEYEMEKLNVRGGCAVLATQRLTFLHNGEALEFVRSTYRADRYRFVVSVKR